VISNDSALAGKHHGNRRDSYDQYDLTAEVSHIFWLSESDDSSVTLNGVGGKGKSTIHSATGFGC
jgi:hypothetical protein